MCKTPKVQEVKQKAPQYLRNPLLDGLRIGAGAGRNALRVDRVDAPAAVPGAGAYGPQIVPSPDAGLSVPPGMSAPGTTLPPGLVIPTPYRTLR
jgi:hypothetical protein